MHNTDKMQGLVKFNLTRTKSSVDTNISKSQTLWSLIPSKESLSSPAKRIRRMLIAEDPTHIK